jgi:putative PIN family toxin of toxin-antitoxin system
VKPAIVPDANILVSACINARGKPAELIRLGASDQLRLLTSPLIWDEMVPVLDRPNVRKYISFSDRQLKQWLADIGSIMEWTPGKLRLKVVASDSDDDKVVACAIEGYANYIVTGDRHLLDIGSYKGIYVVTVENFLQYWRILRP